MKEWRRVDDTWRQGKAVLENDMMGGGPSLAKHKATEKGETDPASLIQAR
jgi:hypothetical protein